MQTQNVERTVAQNAGPQGQQVQRIQLDTTSAAENVARRAQTQTVEREKAQAPVEQQSPLVAMTAEEREKALEHIQKMIDEQTPHSVQIQYSEEDDRFVIEIREPGSPEVVRQIPSEAMLEASRNLRDLQGLLFDERT